MTARGHSANNVSESEEIEVEVVEIVDEVPTSSSSPYPGTPGTSGKRAARRPDSERKPLGGLFSGPLGRAFSERSMRIPAYLWPLAALLGLTLLLLAIVVGLIILIPFLIIRAVVRLLLGPSS